MSQPVNVLFMHIQKTAGMSIIESAQNHYGHSAVLRHADFVGRRSEELASIPFVLGH